MQLTFKAPLTFLERLCEVLRSNPGPGLLRPSRSRKDRSDWFYILKLLLSCILAFLFFVDPAGKAFAATAVELQQRIGEQNASLLKIEKEIQEYTSKARASTKQANTLKNTLGALENARKKLALEIAANRIKIERARLSIASLAIQIDSKEDKIAADKEVLLELTRAIVMEDGNSPLYALLRGESISQILDTTERLGEVEEAVQTNLRNVRSLKAALTVDKSATEEQRKTLEQLQRTVSDQKKIADDASKQQTKLLAETKNQEANYRKLVQKKITEKAAVEKELLNFESQLKTIIDQSRLPSTKKATLVWPVATVRLTQQFGDTAFARSGAYNGKGHNGIDLGGPTGTPILTALTGIVKGTGNTDQTCSGASYGQWVLIEHANGLSTLYAHLSLTKVSTGQTLQTADLVGYMGQTGYATGPHLHFGVIATQGVKIGQLKSRVPGCGTYTLPLASLNSYLNPEEYL